MRQYQRPVSTDPLIGRVVAEKFRLRRLIGSGGTGTVYEADQMTLGRTVAVKVLKPHLAADPRTVERFQAEALAVSRMNHPNTVSVIDYGNTDDDLLFLVLEHLRGPTLRELLFHEFPFSAERIVDTALQILAGLEEAHHADVVHADLKSDNIIVEHRRSDWDLVKVIDFGIARLVGENQAHNKNLICGTPEYMAPEIIRGAAPTYSSDLYAMGVVLYEMLTGVTPFAGGSTADVLERQLRDEPVPPIARRPDMGRAAILQSVALRALAKQPGERFADVADFRRALDEALGPHRLEADSLACESCGARCSTRFKFCPECGQPPAALISTREVPPPDETIELSPADSQQMLRAENDASAGGVLPLPSIARAEPLGVIANLFAGDTGGSLRVVGPLGSGRSTLVRTAVNLLIAGEDTIVYQAHPDPSGLANAFYPIRSVVASILELPQVCAYEDLVASVLALGLVDRDVPGIAELFGHHSELWELEPPVRRRELYASTIRVLNAAAFERGVVLVFEDIDDYDAPSRELVHRLAGRLDVDRRLFVIGTERPSEISMWPDSTVTLELGPLADLARASLADHLAARTAARAVPSVEALASNIGTPSLAYHMARFLSEGGSFEDDTISLADLIAARLRLLPHSSLVLCQTTAAFGREAPAAALMACTQLAAGGTFETALAIGKARGYLYEDDGVVGFNESIVRDVTYDATPADVRRQLHKNIVTALRAEVTDTATLGYHHAKAGDRDDAAALLLAAGDEAAHQLDDVTATRHYQLGLEAARELMLARGGLASQRLFALLSLRLAKSLRAGGDLILARGVLYEAVAHCDRGSMSAAEIAAEAAAVHAAEGDVDQAIDSARRAIGELIPHGRRDLLADLYIALSRLHLERGDAAAALAELTEGVDVVTGGGNLEIEPPHNLWRLLLHTSQLHASLGQLPAAIRAAESALAQADRASSRQGQAKAHAVCAQLYRRVPNDPMTHRHRQAAVEIRRTLGDRRGTAELLLEPPVSRDRLREALTLALEIGWLDGATRAQRQLS